MAPRERGKKTTSHSVIEAKENSFVRFEKWCSGNRKSILFAFSLLTLLFSFLNLNLRVSEGGDDSEYIHAGYRYSKDFFHYFIENNAPLYPMLLSIPIKFFGVNIILLKSLSIVFYFLSFILFLKAFEKRVPYIVLLPVLFFYAVNSYLQYFSSQTFNEAFFLLIQSSFLLFFFKFLDKEDNPVIATTSLHNWKEWLLLGLFITLASLSKNLGIALIPITILFFIVMKQWKNALFTALVAFGTRGIYEVVKWSIWGNKAQFAAQSASFLNKDPYKPEYGSENFSGLMGRFFENCDLYLSKRLSQILGLQSESNYDTHGFLTFLIIALFIASFFVIKKARNRTLLFSWLYAGGLVFVSFIALQVVWDQPRLIVIHVPVLLLIAYFSLQKFLSKYKAGLAIYLSIIITLCGSFTISSLKKSAHSIPVAIRNLKGDPYYGFTPDWQHFLKMSRWCADSLPPNAIVASRKASMSFIYGKGKEFFPINHLLFYDAKTMEPNPDSVLIYFKQNAIRYVIVANLRLYSEANTGEIITTTAALLSPIFHKYPDKIKFIHREGLKGDEPTFLYEILY